MTVAETAWLHHGAVPSLRAAPEARVEGLGGMEQKDLMKGARGDVAKPFLL